MSTVSVSVFYRVEYVDYTTIGSSLSCLTAWHPNPPGCPMARMDDERGLLRDYRTVPVPGVYMWLLLYFFTLFFSFAGFGGKCMRIWYDVM